MNPHDDTMLGGKTKISGFSGYSQGRFIPAGPKS